MTAMPRPKTGNKQDAILAAATALVAAHGAAVSVRQIAQQADVGNGTVFLYFPSKEALLDALHARLDAEVAAWTAGLDAPERDCLQRQWTGYIDWALAHPLAHRALARLDEAAGTAARPGDYASAVFRSLADIAVRFSSADPAAAARYRADGFDAAWRAMAPRQPPAP